jgi:hypothetical protein
MPGLIGGLRGCLVALAAGLLAGCGSGGSGGGGTGSAGASGGVASQPAANSVSGTVTFNGKPLAGVTVIAWNTNTNKVFANVATNAAGHYAVPGLDAMSGSTPNYQFWALLPGYGFAAQAPPGATVKRSDYTGQYNTLYGIYKTVIDYDSLPGGSISGADFHAYDGTHPLVQVAATGQQASFATGDDGALGKGLVAGAQRFTDNGDGTVTDGLTELVWLRDAGCLGSGDWATALGAANQLASGSCGLSDGSSAGQWRVPNLNELASLLDAWAFNPALSPSAPFTGVDLGVYWSSTTYFGLSSEAWAVRMADGRYMNDGNSNDKLASVASAWAVRGASHGVGALAATGQYVSYAAGDDGAVQAGVMQTYPRWVDRGDGTVVDTMTGLTWLKRGDCIHADWNAALATVNALGSGQCGLGDRSKAGDWRMPNRNELLSLADRALGNHADFFDWNYNATSAVGNQPAVFSNLVVADYYWSSTTDAADNSRAWTVYSCDFGAYDTPKTDLRYTLAVR